MQNVLNNRFAIDTIQERLGLEAIYYNNDQYWLTKKMVADSYEVEERTIETRIRNSGRLQYSCDKWRPSSIMLQHPTSTKTCFSA